VRTNSTVVQRCNTSGITGSRERCASVAVLCLSARIKVRSNRFIFLAMALDGSGAILLPATATLCCRLLGTIEACILSNLLWCLSRRCGFDAGRWCWWAYIGLIAISISFSLYRLTNVSKTAKTASICPLFCWTRHIANVADRPAGRALIVRQSMTFCSYNSAGWAGKARALI